MQFLAQEGLVFAVERRRSVDQQTLDGCDAPQVGVCAAQLGGESGQVGRDRHDDANAEDGPSTTSPNGFFGFPSDTVEPVRQPMLMSAIEKASPLARKIMERRGMRRAIPQLSNHSLGC